MFSCEWIKRSLWQWRCVGYETNLSYLQEHEPDSSSSSSSDDSDLETISSGVGGGGGGDTGSTRSSVTSATGPSLESKLNSRADAEFTSEVIASLERAWAEGHAVENAAVELKTLRMASNVPLRRVREAIVRFLLEKIVDDRNGPNSSGGATRDRVQKVIARWGGLIDAIGGVDPVESIEILQVCVLFYCFTYLFICCRSCALESRGS